MTRLSQFIICLFLIISSTTTMVHAYTNQPLIIADENCTLPAPTGLVVTNITGNSADVQWNAVPGAISYAVTALNAATQQVYYQSSTSNLNETCTNLPPSTNIVIRVAPICSGHQISSNVSEVEFSTNIIIDLVMGGYEGCNSPNPWTIYMMPYTNFNLNTLYECQLISSNNNIINYFAFTINGALSGQSVKIYPVTGYTVNTSQNSTVAEINLDNQLISQLAFGYSGPVNSWSARMFSLFLEEDYSIWYRTMPPNCNITHSEVIPIDRNDLQFITDSTTTIWAAPNPFSEIINIQHSGYAQDELAVISLLSIDGKLMCQTSTLLVPNMPVSLATPEIPEGLYVVQVQTSKGIQSLLVKK